jgi:hypothetical protein
MKSGVMGRRCRLFLAVSLAAAPAFAQDTVPARPGHLQGQVVDTAGRPIRAAFVEIDDPPRAVLSDDEGYFHFRELPAGNITVRVRRIPFEEIEFQLRLPSDTTVSIGVKLLPAAQVLGTINIIANAEATHTMLAQTGFYQRQRAGWGRMLTPEDIFKLHNSATDASAYLRGVLGVTVQHPPGGAMVLGRDPRGNPCVMNLVIDGLRTRLNDGESFDEWLTRDEVYAMEVYIHAEFVPMEYQSLLGNDFCGTVVAWTKHRMQLKRAP